MQGYRRTLAASQVLDFLSGVLDVCFIKTACTQKRGSALRPFDEIGLV